MEKTSYQTFQSFSQRHKKIQKDFKSMSDKRTTLKENMIS